MTGSVPIETVLFYVVFIAPGFIAVMTTISLAAIEKEYTPFTLLVWSLVASLVIDTLFIAYYQLTNTLIESYGQLTGILFDPHFQVSYVLGILLFSFLVGITATAGVLADVPGRMRRVLQAKSHVRVNPRQPWSNFVQNTRVLRIKTSDGEIYRGLVREWSRAGRPKEVRLKSVQRLNPETREYIPFDREMLFLEKDIDRLLMLEEDDRPSVWERAEAWFGNRRSVRAVVCGLCDRWRDRQRQEQEQEQGQEPDQEPEQQEHKIE